MDKSVPVTEVERTVANLDYVKFYFLSMDNILRKFFFTFYLLLCMKALFITMA